MWSSAGAAPGTSKQYTTLATPSLRGCGKVVGRAWVLHSAMALQRLAQMHWSSAHLSLQPAKHKQHSSLNRHMPRQVPGFLW